VSLYRDLTRERDDGFLFLDFSKWRVKYIYEESQEEEEEEEDDDGVREMTVSYF